MTRRSHPASILLACLVLVSALGVTPSAHAAAGYDAGDTGPYAVGYTQRVLVDTTRDAGSPWGGRPIAVSMWYPADGEMIDAATPLAGYCLDAFTHWLPPFPSTDYEAFGIDRAYQDPPPHPSGNAPLILFSPGWGGSDLMYVFLGARLASHGFVVAVVTHYADGGLGSLVDPTAPVDPLETAAYNRPLDLSWVLDEILTRNEDASDRFFHLVDDTRVVASGHSLGGYAAMALVCGDADVLGTARTIAPDSRIKAIVPLDGSNQLLSFEELTAIDVPALSIGQDWDHVLDWQARQHAAIAGQPSYRVDLNHSYHNASFTNTNATILAAAAYGFIDSGTASYLLYTSQYLEPDLLPPAESQRLVTMYMVAFLKTYVCGEPGYENILTPGWALTREPSAEFFVTEKRPGAPREDAFWYFPHQPGAAASGLKKPVNAPGVTTVFGVTDN